ncbi:MAG: 16S rRNA (adenine(1518)-N(6)/adenine(1519)-N(6))-dimethyltransferase RsmA [Firmicutes bacterium]|nr:16S rRNA (adenine(1518)-N(6)/adenine(1519)-N(6))-dimethyltransferase RsmA [Bacillota bacterium]
MNLCAPETIKYIQKTFGFKNAKGLGQNFLTDPGVIEAMVDAAEIGPEDLVIEIGPGIGVLTDAAAKRAKKVIAIEIDKALLPVLKYTLAHHNNVEIINEDILKVDLNKIIQEEAVERQNVKIMGNLPYYITTPIITQLLEKGTRAASITIMMQKEVAERIVSPPGKKSFGALSVAVQYYSNPQKVVSVPKEVFFPIPKVDSEVLILTLLEKPAVEVKDTEMFFRLVKAGFAQRRKTLSNSLKGAGLDKDAVEKALEDSGIEGSRRAETLSLEEFAALSDAFSQG